MLECIHCTLCFPLFNARNVSKVVQLFCNGPSGHYPITYDLGRPPTQTPHRSNYLTAVDQDG